MIGFLHGIQVGVCAAIGLAAVVCTVRYGLWIILTSDDLPEYDDVVQSDD